MLAIFPNTVDRRLWVNACEVLANVSIVASRSGSHTLAAKLESTMRAFADELSRDPGIQPYTARVLAKTFMAIGDHQVAVNAANKIANDSKDHWLLYQQAKAELALGRLDRNGCARAQIRREGSKRASKALNLPRLAQPMPRSPWVACGRIEKRRDRTGIVWRRQI